MKENNVPRFRIGEEVKFVNGSFFQYKVTVYQIWNGAKLITGSYDIRISKDGIYTDKIMTYNQLQKMLNKDVLRGLKGCE